MATAFIAIATALLMSAMGGKRTFGRLDIVEANRPPPASEDQARSDVRPHRAGPEVRSRHESLKCAAIVRALFSSPLTTRPVHIAET